MPATGATPLYYKPTHQTKLIQHVTHINPCNEAAVHKTRAACRQFFELSCLTWWPHDHSDSARVPFCTNLRPAVDVVAPPWYTLHLPHDSMANTLGMSALKPTNRQLTMLASAAA